MSSGKKDLSIFTWKFNKETGQYEVVPVEYINPDQFWTRHVKYEKSPFDKWRQWENDWTWYCEDVLDTIDVLVNDMESYPDARKIINYIRTNLDMNDDNDTVDRKSD